jgi:hypothetical protein
MDGRKRLDIHNSKSSQSSQDKKIEKVIFTETWNYDSRKYTITKSRRTIWSVNDSKG